MASDNTPEFARPSDTLHDDFNWAHYLQVELRLRQAKEMLEASLRDAEEAVGVTPGKFGRVLMRFNPKARAESASLARSEELIERICIRINDTNAELVANERELHRRLHENLNATNPEYRMAHEVESRYRMIAESIVLMKKLFAELLARYGSTRAEIGIAYNKSTGELSPSGQASVDRLVASYEALIKAQNDFMDKLSGLNAMVERSMFREMMLPLFEMAVAPDCRPGMEYTELRDHFEAGSNQAKTCLDELHIYVSRISKLDENRDEILRRYRDEQWRQRLERMRDAI